MGNFVYARHCRARHDDSRAMLSLETLGRYAHGHRWPEAPFPLNLFSSPRGEVLGPRVLLEARLPGCDADRHRPLRYRHSHRASDQLRRVGFSTLATVTTGPISMVCELASARSA